MHICGDGVVTNGNSATVTFLCDDPNATVLKCKLNGEKIHQCMYVLALHLYRAIYLLEHEHFSKCFYFNGRTDGNR